MNKYKSIIIMMAGIIGLFFAYKINQKPKIKKIIVNAADIEKITPHDRQILPGANDKIQIIHHDSRVGYIDSVSILRGVSQSVQIDTEKIKWGIIYRPSLYGDYGLSGEGIGIDEDLFCLWRFSAGINAGYPRVGVSASYQLFRNTYLGIGYDDNYVRLISEPVLQIHMGF